jgi:hypothetical protein
MKDKPGCESRGGGGEVGAKQDDSKKTWASIQFLLFDMTFSGPKDNTVN